MILDEAIRDADLARDADAVQIERNGNAVGGDKRIGANAKTRAGGADGIVWQKDRSIGLVIKLWVKIPHAVVRLVRVRYAIPTQAQVEGQSAVHAPVVLAIEGP